MWKYVSYHLSKNGVSSVLVGGSVVAIYTNGLYQSGDLDFVISDYQNEQMVKTFKDLGFKTKGRYFKHPKCQHLYIDIVSPPVGIGDDVGIKPHKKSYYGQTIQILSPTDCIRDRLASYIYFKSRKCFEQAVLVASKNSFQKAKIKKWCENEDAVWAYEELIDALKSTKS